MMRQDSIVSDESSPSTPLHVLRTLFENRATFADITIKCSDGVVIHAHTAVLSAREPFFQSRFSRFGAARPTLRNCIFSESSAVMLPIVEMLYTGVIQELEDAPHLLSEAEGFRWLKVLTWCARNEISSVAHYIHDAIIHHALTPSVAAQLLALLAQADATHDCGPEPETDDLRRMEQVSELTWLALKAYESADITDDVFLPLSREALKLLLSANLQLQAPQIDICRAVDRWAKDSAWVLKNAEGSGLEPAYMTDITDLLKIDKLSTVEFQSVKHLFPEARHLAFYRFKALPERFSSENLSGQSAVQTPVDKPDLLNRSLSRRVTSVRFLEQQAREARTRHMLRSASVSTDGGTTRDTVSFYSDMLSLPDSGLQSTPGRAAPPAPWMVPDSPPSTAAAANGAAARQSSPWTVDGAVAAAPGTTSPPQPASAHAAPAPKSAPAPPRPRSAACGAPLPPGPRPSGSDFFNNHHADNNNNNPPAEHRDAAAAAASSSMDSVAARIFRERRARASDSGPSTSTHSRGGTSGIRSAATSSSLLDRHDSRTGKTAPVMPALDAAAMATHDVARRLTALAARHNPDDPTSAFLAGPGLTLRATPDEFTALVSAETTHHQSLVYKVGITSGRLRWSIEVTRSCDMLWMGVTAEFDLDLTLWPAREPNVWMVSEESSCLTQIRSFTGIYRDQPNTPADMHPAHIGMVRVPCSRCIKWDPEYEDGWRHVVAELRTEVGELWMAVNNTPWQLVFCGLPTDVPLYPIVALTNAAQIKFSHLVATV